MPQAALMSYGAARLLATARDNANREVLAFSNHLLRRTARWPPGLSRIDVIERRIATR